MDDDNTYLWAARVNLARAERAERELTRLREEKAALLDAYTYADHLRSCLMLRNHDAVCTCKFHEVARVVDRILAAADDTEAR